MEANKGPTRIYPQLWRGDLRKSVKKGVAGFSRPFIGPLHSAGTFPDSSAVELSTVNRAAVGSNPTQGATGAVFSQTAPAMTDQPSITCGTNRAVFEVISPSSRMPIPTGAPSTTQLPSTGKHPGAASGRR